MRQINNTASDMEKLKTLGWFVLAVIALVTSAYCNYRWRVIITKDAIQELEQERAIDARGE